MRPKITHLALRDMRTNEADARTTTDYTLHALIMGMLVVSEDPIDSNPTQEKDLVMHLAT
jgi:hypothetical protein